VLCLEPFLIGLGVRVMWPNHLINRTAYALRAPAAGYRTR